MERENEYTGKPQKWQLHEKSGSCCDKHPETELHKDCIICGAPLCCMKCHEEDN